MEQFLATMTEQAASLRQREPHTLPGQVPVAIATLEQLALKLAERHLIGIEQLAGFLEVSGSGISGVVLIERQAEAERLAYIDRLNRLAPDQLAAKAE